MVGEKMSVDTDLSLEQLAGMVEEKPAQQPLEEEVVEDIAPIEEEIEEQPTPESEARKYGWKPEEEWKGDKTKWKPAEDFLEGRTDSIITLKNTVDRLDKTNQVILKHAERQAAFQEAQLKQARDEAYGQAMYDIELRLQAAYKEGDLATAGKLNNAKENLIRTDEATRAGTPEVVPPEEDPTVNNWIAKNDWYGKDVHMTAFAKGLSGELKHLPYDQQLAKVDEEVKKAFPYKFQQRARLPNNATLATQQRTPGKRTPAPNSYEALTPEWKREADKFVEGAASRMPKDKARAEYLKYLPADAFNN